MPSLVANVMMYLHYIKLMDTCGNRQQIEIDLVGTMSSHPQKKQLKSYHQNALTIVHSLKTKFIPLPSDAATCCKSIIYHVMDQSCLMNF